MREIKFRGRSNEQGRWLYGDLLNDRGKRYIQTDGGGGWQIVDPATIGQYTGLKDCNGVEIYEGDILSKGQAIREVYFDEDRFYNGAYSLALSVEAGFKVIGNIYDNPELLKGGEK